MGRARRADIVAGAVLGACSGTFLSDLLGVSSVPAILAFGAAGLAVGVWVFPRSGQRR